MRRIEQAKGILLDIGLTADKHPQFLRMAQTKAPGVDIVHDRERFPWPLEDNACLIILAAHVIEHVKPWNVVPFMNELWRVMKPNGQLALSTPYAGSPTWHHDPTHCTGFTELSFCYFAPAFPALYNIHTPKPWLIDKGSPVWKSEQNIECLLRAIK